MGANPFFDLAMLGIPCLLVYFWWGAARVKELAVGHAQRACVQQNVQLLDQTVALKRMRVMRNAQGYLYIQREFNFDFTNQEQFRDTGVITMRSQQLREVYFPFIRDAQGNRIYVH